MPVAALATVAFCGTLLFVWRPVGAVWLAVILLFFGNRPEIPFLHFWDRYLSTAGIAFFVGAVGLRHLLSRRRIHRDYQSWPLQYVPFVMLAMVSAVYNGSTPRDVVLSLLTNLRYPLFFWALSLSETTATQYRAVLRWFVLFTLLQVPVSMAQFYLGMRGDLLCGTLGSGTRLAEVVMITQALLLADAVGGSHFGTKRWFARVGGAVVLFVPALLSDSQITLIVFLILVLYCMLLRMSVRNVLRLMIHTAAIAAAAVVAVGSVAIFVPAVHEFVGSMSGHKELLQDWRDPAIASYASVGRLTILFISVPLLVEKPVRLIWGFGPESTEGGVLSGNSMTSPEDLLDVGGIVCRKLAAMGVISREPQTFRSIMEFGFVGTLAFLVPPVFLWRRVGGRLDANRAEVQMVRFSLSIMAFIYLLLCPWYSGVWRLDTFGLAFWLVAGWALEETRHPGFRRTLKMTTLHGSAVAEGHTVRQPQWTSIGVR